MARNQRGQNDALVSVLSIAFVAGMTIAVLLLAIWRSHPDAIAHDAVFRTAVAFCPPFMLVRAVGGLDDTTLALVLTSGTVIMANGSLYAGLAAFAYWGFSNFWPRSRPQ